MCGLVPGQPFRGSNLLVLCLSHTYMLLLHPSELSIVYSSRTAISLLQVGPGTHSKQVQEWQEAFHLQDVDWKRSVLYGTDDSGALLRVVGHPGKRETIVTGLPGEILCGDGQGAGARLPSWGSRRCEALLGAVQWALSAHTGAVLRHSSAVSWL